MSGALPHSKDHSHHLSRITASRDASKWKILSVLSKQDDMMSLAGGLPQADVFPMKSASFKVPSLKSLDGGMDGWRAAASQVTETGEGDLELNLFKNQEGGAVDLRKGLQYSMGPNGFPEFYEPLEELMQLLHSPPYADVKVTPTLGCTDGVSKTFTLFLNQNSSNVLCERSTFGSSLTTGRQAHGGRFWPVEVDGDGLVPESLNRVMSTWDEKKQGDKPSLLYIIPCGQNPTGSVPTEARYAEIYALCQKHDLIIMEDDPYYFLQYQPYNADPEKRKALLDAHQLPPLAATPKEEDVKALAQAWKGFAGVNSYLSRDVDGRVVRLDTYSKIFAPGLRSGWITCNEKFQERLFRITETSTNVLSCFTQSVLASYFSDEHGWGLGGFIRWLSAIRLDYQEKRDKFVDGLRTYCPEEYVSTVAPMGGMFCWVKLAVEKHYRFKANEAGETNTNELMQELFDALVAQKLVVYPGGLFVVQSPLEKRPKDTPFIRCTFAGTVEQSDKALRVLGKVVREFFDPKEIGGDGDI